MNLMNKLLDNLEKCKNRCQLSMTVRTLNGENNLYECKGLTCDKCKEQVNVMLDEWRKELNNNGWIPVEEDVTDKECLCCNERGFIVIGFLTKDGRSTTGYAARSDLEISDFEVMLDIVAWQPLPKPYKKES